MKVGIVAFSGVYPMHIGGPSSVAYFVAKRLGELGDDVTVFIRCKTRKQADSVEQVDEFKNLKNVDFVPVAINYVPQTFINIPYLAQELYKALKRFNHENFDVVHYNSPPVDAAFLFPIMSKRKREKQTLAVHGGLFVRSKYALGKRLVKMEKYLFDRVIAFNDFSKDLAREAGFEEDKIVVIPNGVELEVISKSKPLNLFGQPKILYVGVLTESKGVAILLRAFAELFKQFPRASLYIVGDGPLRDYLEQMAGKLKIQSNVIFTGHIPTMTVYKYYKSVDISVLPSYIENFSITLLESMASKVPIIASDAEGNLEVISDRRNGVTFPRGDYKILSEKIRLLLSDSNFAQKLVANAYKDVKDKYNWKEIGLLYHNTFQSLVN